MTIMTTYSFRLQLLLAVSNVRIEKYKLVCQLSRNRRALVDVVMVPGVIDHSSSYKSPLHR